MSAATAEALDEFDPLGPAPREGTFSLGNRAINPARRVGRLDQLETQVEQLFDRARIAVTL